MIPQLIMIVLMSLGLGVHMVKHGEEKDSKYNFFWRLIAVAISLSILYSGGFFNVLNK